MTPEPVPCCDYKPHVGTDEHAWYVECHWCSNVAIGPSEAEAIARWNAERGTP